MNLERSIQNIGREVRREYRVAQKEIERTSLNSLSKTIQSETEKTANLIDADAFISDAFDFSDVVVFRSSPPRASDIFTETDQKIINAMPLIHAGIISTTTACLCIGAKIHPAAAVGLTIGGAAVGGLTGLGFRELVYTLYE